MGRQLAVIAIVAALSWAGALRAEDVPSVAKLTEQLSASDREVRREATYQLGKLGPAAAPALPGLIKATEDQDKQVWSNALSAIANIGPDAKDAVPALLDLLDSRRSQGRGGMRDRERQQVMVRVAYALSRIGPAAIPPLIEALKSDSGFLRIGATKALGGMGAVAESATPSLVQNLGSTDYDLRRETIEALAQIGGPAVKPLADALVFNDARVREGAALALTEIGADARGAEPAVKSLLENDQDKTVKAAAFLALARISSNPDQCVTVLMEGVRSDDQQLRHAAINALLSVRAIATKAVPALVTELKDDAAPRRQRAAQVLGRLGPSAAQAVPELIQAARKEPGEPAFPQALAQIGPAALDSLVQVLAQKDGTDHEWVFRALKDIGLPALTALGEALKSPDPAVRAGAAQALSGMPLEGQPVVKSLVELSSDTNADVRAAALRTLSTIRSQRERIAPKLEASLQDPAPQVRKAAAAGLASMGAVNRIGTAGLMELLADGDPAIQISAIQALGELGEKAADAAPVLLQKIDVPALRLAVTETLGRIGPAAEPAIPRLIEAAKSQDHELSIAGLKALGNIGRRAELTLPILYNAWQTGDREIRYAALDAIGKTETDESKLIALLTNALKEESGRMRKIAAQSLKRWGAKAESAVPNLIVMLDRETDRANALETLRAIGIHTVPPLLGLLNHKEASVRIFACESLGQLGPAAAEAVSVLEQKEQSDTETVRGAAHKALEKIRSKPPVS